MVIFKKFDDKAQLHTLEGVAAAALMLTVMIYIIDATSMTPLTSSSSNMHMESELGMLGQDILNNMNYAEPGYDSKLKSDIMNWNGNEYVWNGTNYAEKGAEDSGRELKNNLTDILAKVLARKAIAHNVEMTYISTSNNATYLFSKNMISNGDPSNNAIKISRKIALHDEDINSTLFPSNLIGDIDPSTNLYNIIDVKIVMWRI